MADTFVAGSREKRRRYRRWSKEAKRVICLETRAPGVSVAQWHTRRSNLQVASRSSACAPAWCRRGAPVFLPVQLRNEDAPRGASKSATDGNHGRVEIVSARRDRAIAQPA